MSQRLKLLEVVSQLRRILPSMRFGQLVCNLAGLVDASTDAVWAVEDESLLAEAEDFLGAQVLRLGLSSRSPSDRELIDGKHCDADREAGGDIPAVAWCLDRFADRRFGEVVAALVAREKRPESPADWAASIWDVRDDDLESVARQVMLSGADLADAGSIAWVFRSGDGPKYGTGPSDRILPTEPLRSHSNSG